MNTPRPFATTVRRLAVVFALGGAGLLGALALLVVISVFGRVVFGRPVPGDFEIVATGTAVAVFLCLPYCQITRGNLVVDLFLDRVSPWFARLLDALSAVLFGFLALLFAWRMCLGLVDVYRYQDVSIILGFPLWWAYPFAIASFLVLACACAVTCVEDLSGDTA